LIQASEQEMNRKNRTLAFLAKHYHPFTHFTFEMLKDAGEALLRLLNRSQSLYKVPAKN
jgi:hypothetical protein